MASLFKYIYHKGLFAVSLILCSFAAQSQSISASVNKNPVGEGDQFKYIIRVDGVRSANVAPPSFSDFNLMGGPYSSSNFSMSNGNIEQYVTYSYVLSPKQKGLFTIAPATVVVQGKKLGSNSISLQVVQGSSSNASNQNSGSSSSASGKNVFIKTFVSKSNVYQGEQISINYVLYCNSRMNFDLVEYDFPKLNGFWKEDVKIKEIKWESQSETIEGRNYRKAYLAKQVLFPQQFGDIIIEPFTIEGRVGRSFFNQGQAISERSNSVKLTVKQLPPGAPSSFNGAIGKFAFQSETDRTELKVNESLNLKLTVSGSGNLKLINEIPINFPKDFEVYDPDITDKIYVGASGMSGSRSFNYLVIPRHEGSFEIPPVEFSYFDPEVGKYNTFSSLPFNFEIARSEDQTSEERLKTIRKEGVSVVEEDIRYIKNTATLKPYSSFFLGTPAYYGVLFSPALAVLFFLFYKQRKEREEKDPIGKRRKQARGQAKKLMSDARKYLNSNEKDKFYEALSQALNGYLGGKLSLEAMELNLEQIEINLKNRNIDPVLISNYMGLMERCQMARFAPTSDQSDASLLSEAEKIIEQIEEVLK